MAKKSPATNTAMRYLRMLSMIPAYPARISTSHVVRKLREDNERYAVTQRSVQRDLELLAEDWDLSFDQDGRTKRWYFNRKVSLQQIPTMGDSAALALLLSEEYLSSVLPGTAMELLGAHFRHARGVLKGTKLGAWQKKVRFIQRGPTLIPPRVRPEVHRVVHEALMEGRQITVKYRGRQGIEKSYPLSPLGLVLKDGMVYLVGVAWNMDTPATFALHRLLGAELIAETAHVPPGFSLEAFVMNDKAFAYPLSSRKLKLQVRFIGSSGFHLGESRLAEDQVIRQLPGGDIRVTATVDDTSELRWWILGFGSKVEVERPAALRKEIAEAVSAASALYRRRGKR